MLQLRNRPKGVRSASFGLGLCFFALIPTEIGYQDIASLLARQPGVAERWQKQCKKAKTKAEGRGTHALRPVTDRKSTRLNSSHTVISYAVFCLKKKNHADEQQQQSHVVCPHAPEEEA